MKLLKPFLYVLIIAVSASCGVKFNTISFNKKRTPLNRIAHNGIVNYHPIIHIKYAKEPLREQEEYQREVGKRKKEYKTAMRRFNNATIAERISQGLTKPQLIFPVKPPEPPYLYNQTTIANKIKIQGMKEGATNALEINVYLNGFDKKGVDVVKSTRKKEKNGVEVVDTVYNGQAKVRHDLSLLVKAPNGEKYSNELQETKQYQSIKTVAKTSKDEVERDLEDEIESKEKSIVYDNINIVNRVLNSQFGTQIVKYTVKLFTIDSDKDHDYSDLRKANIDAQVGFKLLNSEPNKAYKKLGSSFQTWKTALAEYSDYKDARINDKVKQGLLINLFATSIYTDNWSGAIQYMTELENMKLKASTNAELARLKGIYNDLKKRYEVLGD